MTVYRKRDSFLRPGFWRLLEKTEVGRKDKAPVFPCFEDAKVMLANGMHLLLTQRQQTSFQNANDRIIIVNYITKSHLGKCFFFGGGG